MRRSRSIFLYPKCLSLCISFQFCDTDFARVIKSQKTSVRRSAGRNDYFRFGLFYSAVGQLRKPPHIGDINGLSERHARALLKLEEEDVIPVLERIIEKKMNVTQAEKYIEDLLTQKNSPKRTTKRLFSDVKIFLKTINNAVETMQSAGINANLKKNETEESFVYEIVIPKSEAYKQQAIKQS